jgi:uncharacterized protein
MTPWLRPSEALELHLALLEDSLSLTRRAASLAGATAWISLSEPWTPGGEGPEARLRRALAGLESLPQRGADLGERLRHTLEDLLGRGHRSVVVIGSDSPTLAPARIRSAFARLEEGAEVVLGPADDGGYYLIGARRLVPPLFSEIPWGTARVLERTIGALEAEGIAPALLPPWYDIDRPEDLARARDDLAAPGDRFVPARTAAFIEALARAGRLPAGAPPRSPGR